MVASILQAADAVRGRIDGKYALVMELNDAGCDSTVLCEFRNRLCEHQKSNQLLDLMLEHFKQHNLIKPRSTQRTELGEGWGGDKRLSARSELTYYRAISLIWGIRSPACWERSPASVQEVQDDLHVSFENATYERSMSRGVVTSRFLPLLRENKL